MTINYIPQLTHFYTLSFQIFFLTVFCAYWIVPQKIKNPILLTAGYVFYASWSIPYLGLLIASSLINYFAALGIKTSRHGRHVLWVGVCINVLILATFKYADFFINSVAAMLNAIGIGAARSSLEIILPLGISFYTFQGISYLLDVHREKIPPERDIFTFCLYKAFFPQLIAGPIERAMDLIPRLKRKKSLHKVHYRKALYLFIFGLFKKRVIADYLDVFVSGVYENPGASGAEILLAMIGFTCQVFCDVSGYADMARGLAAFLGIRLSRNFYFPFFAQNPVQFWKRWHITLSNWVRFYLYIPLLSLTRRPYFSVALAFLVMGLWHGPRWHFVHWGIYWALVSVSYQILVKPHSQHWKSTPINVFLATLAMLLTTIVGQSFFRAEGIAQYLRMQARMISAFDLVDFFSLEFGKLYACVAFVFLYELFLFRKRDEFYITRRNFYAQALFYCLLFILFRNIGSHAATDFVYYNF